jgi:hypothetical protein
LVWQGWYDKARARWVTNLLLLIASLSLLCQMNQQQHNELEEQQEPPAAHPLMSLPLQNALVEGDIVEIRRLLDDGESINCVDSAGNNPILMSMSCGHLHVVQMLADRGADLTIFDSSGWNLLHWATAGMGANVGIEWVLANTTIDVNSTTDDGDSSIAISLLRNDLIGSKLLVEKGANLFKKDNDGKSAIDMRNTYCAFAPQVLQHALDLRWASIRHLLLISNLHETSDITSSSLAASVFTITGLVRHIAEYLIRTEIIVRDPATKKKDKEPDDVKRRVEAALAANEKKNHDGN